MGQPPKIEPHGVEPEPAGRVSMPWRAAGAVVLACLAALAVSTASDGDEEPLRVTRLQPITPRTVLPAVEGLRVEEGIDRLQTAGIDLVESRWVANERVESGEIAAQEPDPGTVLAAGEGVAIEVSAGGPATGWIHLPPSLRDELRNHPRFDTTEPILVIDTPHGPAFKTDPALFGACDAVAAVSLPDPSYDRICVGRGLETVEGTLPDGTSYEVTGLPPGEDHRLEMIVGWHRLDDPAAFRHLAVMWLPSSEPETHVDVRNRDLRVVDHRWTMVIGGWEALPSALRDELSDRIRLSDRGGFPKIASPPELAPRDGSIGGLEAHHGFFRLVKECPATAGRCGGRAGLFVEPSRGRSWLDVYPVDVSTGD